jgi:ketosteroid isomerase-like protein
MRLKTLLLTTAFAAMTVTAAPALASDTADIQALADKYDTDINKGDMNGANALCADHAVVIDDFAPHVWTSARACADWADGLASFEKKNGITDDKVTMGKPWHVSVTGDRGYAVFPTHYSYKLNGKPVLEGGVWTMSFQKLASGWRITGWAWAQH